MIMTRLSRYTYTFKKDPELAERYEQLVKNHNEKQYFTGKELDEAFGLCNRASYEIGIEAVAYTTNRTPNGWKRAMCKICSKPLDGVIYDPRNNLGAYVMKKCKDWCHPECNTTTITINKLNIDSTRPPP